MYGALRTHTHSGWLRCPLNNCKTVDNVEFVACYVGVVVSAAAVGDDDGGGSDGGGEADAENNIVDDVINQFPWTHIHFHSHWYSYSPLLISSIYVALKHTKSVRKNMASGKYAISSWIKIFKYLPPHHNLKPNNTTHRWLFWTMNATLPCHVCPFSFIHLVREMLWWWRYKIHYFCAHPDAR